MMRKKGCWLLVWTFAAWGAGGAQAAETATADLVDRSAFRVCADPNNLPFSNQAGKGFENQVAELLARDLGVPVTYTHHPDTIGFIRNTLNAGLCDVVMGVGSANELLQNTNPYYTSAYALLYRADSGLDIETLGDPGLAGLTIGVVAQTPPVTVLAQRGLLRNIRSYHLLADTRHHSPAKDLVMDVAAGELDVGLVWGPIAGYWATRQEVPLVVVPLVDEPGRVPMSFRISMGVRHGEHVWKRQLNSLIESRQDDINAILREYGVPLLDRRGQPMQGADRGRPDEAERPG